MNKIEDTENPQQQQQQQQQHKCDGPRTSKIPGLSQTISMDPEEKTRGRRVGILETDSKYVKLAKQGGQKGLLCHEETNLETKPNSPYKPPDWFTNSDTQGPLSPMTRTIPDFMNYEEFKKSAKDALQPLDTPFGRSDNKSAWERDVDSVTTGKEKECGVTNTASQMENLSLLGDYQEVNKFKKTSFNKRDAPVSMSKLLSFGYVEEDKKSSSHGALSVTSDLTGSALPRDDQK